MNHCKLLFLALRLWLLGYALDGSARLLDRIAKNHLQQQKPLTGRFLTRYAAFCEGLSLHWKRLETRFLLLRFGLLVSGNDNL